MAKRIKRKVLDLYPEGKNSRGNPEHWRVLLECGHIKYDRHSARQTIRLLTMALGELKATCRNCAEGRPVNAQIMSLGDVEKLSGAPLLAVFDVWDAKGLNTRHARAEALKEGRLP